MSNKWLVGDIFFAQREGNAVLPFEGYVVSIIEFVCEEVSDDFLRILERIFDNLLSVLGCWLKLVKNVFSQILVTGAILKSG